MIETNIIYHNDALNALGKLPDNSIDLVITSPPYFQQREYGGGSGIGNEDTIDAYIYNILLVFKECIRVIKPTGTVVFNVGDKYINGNLLLIPYRFAIAAQQQKEVRLVNELTWIKTNPTPKQDTRKLICATEPFFIFAKSNDYFFDKDAFLEYKDKLLNTNKRTGGGAYIGKKYFDMIDKSDLSTEEKEVANQELNAVIQEVREGKIESFRMKIRGLHALPYGGQAGGRLTQINVKGFTIIKIYGNSIRKDVIESTVETIKGNIHPAVYPEYLVQEIIKLLTPNDAIVLDPFLGSGTTAVVAKRLNRKYIGIEIFDKYIDYAEKRLQTIQAPFLELFL